MDGCLENRQRSRGGRGGKFSFLCCEHSLMMPNLKIGSSEWGRKIFIHCAAFPLSSYLTVVKKYYLALHMLIFVS
jgi:hypothetical protein